MANLYIIGNGFDLAHGLKTSYEDFHAYLKDRFPASTEDKATIPDGIPDGFEEGKKLPEEKTAVKTVEEVSLLRYLISNAMTQGDQWKDLEAALGDLDFSDCFEDLPRILDKDGDPDLFHQYYNNEDRAHQLIDSILSISKYFFHWIHEITIDVPPLADFSALLHPEQDFFLTFNYTMTLEKLYDAKHVCHIHGKLGEELLFGHGIIRNLEQDPRVPSGAGYELQFIHDGLRKNTRKAIMAHRDFLKTAAKSARKVLSFGFSYSQADQPYIQFLCQNLPFPHPDWYFLTKEDQEQLPQFEKVIRACGFRGAFKGGISDLKGGISDLT